MEAYKSNICIVDKDVNTIKKELDLYEEKNKKKIENFWDVVSCNDWNNIIEILKSKISSYNLIKEKNLVLHLLYLCLI